MATATIRPTVSNAAMPKRFALSDFQKGGSGLPPHLMIVGRPSVGKTSVAAQADSPVAILSKGETGLHTLIDAGQLPATIPSQEIEHFQQALWIIDDLIEKQHGRKSLFIDTANGLERLANEMVCARDFDGDQKKFMNYQAGYAAVGMGPWKQLLVALDDLRRKRGMQIILLVHTSVRNHKNPGGDDYQRWVPAFDGKQAFEMTVQWCDAVLFADYEVFTSEDKAKKVKGRSSDRRFFRCNWTAAIEAKNRLGLPDEIEMGNSPAEAWANLLPYLKHTNNGKAGQ